MTALIVEDPDAPDPEKPQGLWIHWVVVDLPPTSTGLPEAVGALPAGVILKLYALDRELHLEKPTKYLLDRVIANEVVLAEAKLVVTYQSRNRA